LELEQLKQLVFDGGFDEESRKQVQDLEDRLHKLAVAENLKSHPPVKEWIDYLETQISHCNTLLRNDRTLTDLQRQVLFEKRDICEQFVSMFDGSGKEVIEQEINTLLDAAKNS
jgi:hypothetical protein